MDVYQDVAIVGYAIFAVWTLSDIKTSINRQIRETEGLKDTLQKISATLQEISSTLRDMSFEVSTTLGEIRSDISNLDISIRDLKRTAEKESIALRHSIQFERR